MGGRPNGASLEKTERKVESPLRPPRVAEQPRRHGSSARYVRDPMTQGYRPEGACRSYNTKEIVAEPRTDRRCFSLYHLDHGHNPSNTSCDPRPPGQLGAGRLPYRRVCICVAHGKHYRLFSETR